MLLSCTRYKIVVSGQFASLVDGKWNGIVGLVHTGVSNSAHPKRCCSAINGFARNGERCHVLGANEKKMFSLLHWQEADMALTGLTITSQRETAVDFTIPFFLDVTSIAIKTSSKVSVSSAESV